MARGTGPVLVVDDDAAIRSAIVAGLEHAGYHVLEAPDGRVGLEQIDRVMPRAVVLDVRMPRLDGAGFVRELQRRGLRDEIAVLMISADRDGDTSAQDVGADVYLAKPVRLAGLLAAVEKLLD
ncbi:MAG: response regulator [Chloroflexota bacterium]